MSIKGNKPPVAGGEGSQLYIWGQFLPVFHSVISCIYLGQFLPVFHSVISCISRVSFYLYFIQ